MVLKFNAKSALLYAVYGLVAIFLNAAIADVPLALGPMFAMLICGTNLILTPAVYVLASIIRLNLFASLISLFEGAFLALVTLIYRKTRRKIRIEGAAYLIIALAPYIAFADYNGVFLPFLDNVYATKSIAAIAVMIFTWFCFKTVYAVLYRVMRCRLKEDELICMAVVFAAAGIGFFNLAGEYVYTAFAAGAIILLVRIAKSPSSIICALVLAVPPAAVLLSPHPFTAYIAAAAAALLVAGAGRFAPSIIIAALTATYCFFNGSYDCGVVFIVLRALLLLCTVALPAVFSDAGLKGVKNRLLVIRELPDTAVERSRRRTGEKLYRISEVFREIECAFNALDDGVDDGNIRKKMFEELKDGCCKTCDRAKRCAATDVYPGFKKLIDCGCVKGHVNLIDLPSEITVNCSEPAEVLQKLNGLLAEYRRFMTETENMKSGRKLLAEQAKGVAEVMKNCGVDLSRTYSDSPQLEKLLSEGLTARGISCPELYIDSENAEILITVCGAVDIRAIVEVIENTLKKKYILKDKLCYDGEKRCLVFCAPPRLDAAFGVAYAIKNGERVSGDTHSVIRINERSFLMALSDGMGSGEYARKVSATAISLIEAFYRAEMPEGTVLKTINKLLSFNRDERFTCIDIAAINLDTGLSDFVKIGSPAGIIIRENEIKVLESQSLPLGILDNLHPTVSCEQLKAGDIVVFMSDGITSAFCSTTELYEFLRTLRPLNPQNLADTILAGAKRRAEKINDDMTVLCTRLFEKVN